MKNITLDINKLDATTKDAVSKLAAKANECNATLQNGNGAGNDFLGWLHLPSSITEEELAALESQLNQQQLQAAFNRMARQHMKDIFKMRKANDTLGLKKLEDTLFEQAKQEVLSHMFRFNDEQKKAYTTMGGAPHLDGQYTVFGEVIEGMDVVDAIQNVKTGRADRPIQNVTIEKITVEE